MNMDPLYMLELRFDLIALHRFLHAQGLCGGEDGDIGYGIHAWLGAAFGELAPKPWRLLMNGKRPPRILGYGPHDASVLTQRIVEFAEPTVLQVCPEPAEMIASRPMPTWDRGRRLGFQVLVCPVGRKSSTGTEKRPLLDPEQTPAAAMMACPVKQCTASGPCGSSTITR